MNYQKLFDYMSEEHGVTLLEQDMQEIQNIVNEMQSDELHQPPVIGSVCRCKICGCEIKVDVGDSLCAECWSAN